MMEYSNKKIIIKSLIILIILNIILFLIGCGSKLRTIKEIYSNDYENVTIEVKARYANGSYVIFEDNTGMIAYNRKNGDRKDITAGNYYKISAEVISYENTKQIGNIDKLEQLGKLDITESKIKQINQEYVDENKEHVVTDYIEISGYSEYIQEEFCVNNKYCNVLGYTKNLISNEIETFYGKYINVKAYIVGYNDTKKAYELVIVSCEESFDAGTDTTFDLHILELNDTHGYCLQDENGKNGLSNMSYLINNIRNEDNSNTVLIANGDMFQGTAISNMTHGKAMIEIMNAMKFDCMGIGNHEFDWGLETVLNYFDNDKSNGEANFPLLNANVYKVENSELVSLPGGNVLESTIIEKNGIKVGVIGLIGDVYTSINYAYAKDYYFDNNVAGIVSRIGENLKSNGCDVIVVSIHGADASSVEAYMVNQALANLKYNNEYMIDAVINGHTHTKQSGYIERENGVRLPIVQSGSNGKAFGDIVLKINMRTKKVLASVVNIHDVYEADKNFDSNVEDAIKNIKKQYSSIFDEVYSVAGETVNSTSDLMKWVGNVLVKGADADISICNIGGLRSTGKIKKGNNITIENMYLINPFDNKLVICKVKGEYLASYLLSGNIFYGTNEGIDASNLENDKMYTVAVIDYVYNGTSFPLNELVSSTDIIMRELLIEDLKLRSVFNPITDPKARIGKKVD